MNTFDREDRRGSARLDAALADPVSFVPTVPLRGGDRITVVKGRNTAAYKADPAREARPRAGETDFVAIVTWRSFFTEASEDDGTKRDALAANDVMLDFDRRRFQKDGVETLPRQGDIFELPTESGQSVRVQQSREPYDDGGVRIVVFCIAPDS